MAGIPEIEPYVMPPISEVAENVAPWRVDPDRALVLIHDMQRFFLAPFPADRSPRTELLPNVGALRAAAAAAGVPVAYTVQPGDMSDDQRGLLKDFWGPGMRADPEDRRVEDTIAPGPADTVYTKWRYSAFFGSTLLEDLRRQGRDQLVLCGVYAHVGVLMTAVEAFTHDVETFVVADGVADFGEAEHRMALDYAARRCAVVATTDAVVGALAPVLSSVG